MVAVLAITIRLKFTSVSFEYLLLASLFNFLPSSTGGSADLFDVDGVWLPNLHNTGWSSLPTVG